MLKFFRRKKDDKSMAGNAEQELSTIRKLDMAKEALEKLSGLVVERRFRVVPVEFERRHA